MIEHLLWMRKQIYNSLDRNARAVEIGHLVKSDIGSMTVINTCRLRHILLQYRSWGGINFRRRFQEC